MYSNCHQFFFPIPLANNELTTGQDWMFDIHNFDFFKRMMAFGEVGIFLNSNQRLLIYFFIFLGWGRNGPWNIMLVSFELIVIVIGIGIVTLAFTIKVVCS